MENVTQHINLFFVKNSMMKTKLIKSGSNEHKQL